MILWLDCFTILQFYYCMMLWFYGCVDTFFSPNTITLSVLPFGNCLWQMASPEIVLSSEAPAPWAVQDGEPGLEALPWDCSGAQDLIALLNQLFAQCRLGTDMDEPCRGNKSLSSSASTGDGLFNEELFINFIFGPKTSAVKSCPAQNHRGRICCLGLTIHWQRGELALGVLYISFPPLETSLRSRGEKSKSKPYIVFIFSSCARKGE